MSQVINKLKTFFELPTKVKILFIEAMFISSFARLISFIPLRFYRPLLGKFMQKAQLNNTANLNTVKQIKQAIKISAKYSLLKRKCLVNAITAKIMLNMHNLKSTMYFGLQRGNTQLNAHAWVISNNIVVTGEAEMNNYIAVSWIT